MADLNEQCPSLNISDDNRHQYDVPATNTGWNFEAGSYDCSKQ